LSEIVTLVPHDDGGIWVKRGQNCI